MKKYIKKYVFVVDINTQIIYYRNIEKGGYKMIALRIKDNNEFSTMIALNGMTKQDLSRAVGVRPTYFYYSNNNVGVKTANKVAKILHKDVKDIFFCG